MAVLAQTHGSGPQDVLVDPPGRCREHQVGFRWAPSPSAQWQRSPVSQNQIDGPCRPRPLAHPRFLLFSFSLSNTFGIPECRCPGGWACVCSPAASQPREPSGLDVRPEGSVHPPADPSSPCKEIRFPASDLFFSSEKLEMNF